MASLSQTSFSMHVVHVLGIAAAHCLLLCVKLSSAEPFDKYYLSEVPEYYAGYDQQCGYNTKCSGDQSCPSQEMFGEYEKEAFIKAVAEMLSNEEQAQNSCYRIGKDEFDFGLFQTNSINPNEDLDLRRTLTTDKFLKTLAKKVGKCQLRNLLDGKCYANLTLSCCNGSEQIACDPNDPYRTYDGSCNNLQHPSWGKRGSALKHPFAPCYSDVVSKPARSKSGAPLPQNRKLISELANFLDKYGPNTSSSLNMFMVFWMEVMNSDMIGRANKRSKCPTQGFRGCRADGLDRSAFVSTLSNPLRIPSDDRYYGGSGISCLNFSPQEKANDRCELKHVGDRNKETSYLDLSSLYGPAPHYDANGKLPLYHCGATASIAKASPLAVQFVAIIGLFGKLHNYCVDRVRSCPKSKGSVQERCRALTIGVYQKIIYAQLFPLLFGDELYNLCGFDCEYNPYAESAVSQAYKNAIGRFPHVWVTDEVKYKQDGRSQWRPLNEYFRNHESFDCSATLAGVLETPMQTDRLVDAIVNKFFSADGQRGSCLPCLDLARNRDSGLCPLVQHKHFVEQIVGEESKCYNTFDDLRDMFSPELIEFFARHYEHPGDIDVLFANMDHRAYPGANLPKLVSQSFCIEFKRLKCTDRFFYTWNPNLGEGAKHLIEILDFTALLALFTDMDEVPLEPFLVDSPKVAATDVRKYLESVDYLYCQV
ncbi:chorion peroxidase-like [Anopheles stephensi]|uniref:chorion peroxidase-like n=1 Tax=Anopheles stephensi TaxID=30069 RepID=UPI0016587AA0|nr:chorion peroxidase-like [Anopheles stephensi]